MTLTPGDQVELLQQIASIKTMVEDTYKAITGDPSLGHRGLAERVERTEVGMAHEATERREAVKRVHERVDVMRDEWAKWKWFVAGLAAGMGFAGGGLATWLIERMPG